jgi:hypothetical protein
MPSLHPYSHYTDFNLVDTSPAAELNLTPAILEDVPGMFQRLSREGDLLGCRDGGIFVAGREHRYTGENVQGIDAGINHMQGMMRLGRGRDAFVVLSAGDSTELVAHLFIMMMGTRPVIGAWGSNLRSHGMPTDADGLVRVVALERARWHPGGMGMVGEVLAVPVEGNGTSAVYFLHMADPLNPTRLPITIERPEFPNAGAAALGRLPDGRVICLVWREEGKKKPIGRMDWYVSPGPDLRKGFGPCQTVRFPGLQDDDDRDPKYQSVMLLHPSAQDPQNPTLYLLGTENGAGDAPFGNGPNVADLFRVTTRSASGEASGAISIKAIEHVGTLTFRASRAFCNFDAATGGYVDLGPFGPMLHLYGGFHWRTNRVFQFAEFAGRPDPGARITDPRDACIELYEHDGFQGRRLVIYGLGEATIPDYSRIFVQDGDFDRRVSSVRWHLPTDFKYQLFRERNFAGPTLDLVGSGTVKEIGRLSRRKFGDIVSSSRFASRP